MSLSFKVQVRNRIPELRRELRPRAERVLAESAMEIASIARQLCPVDTGDLHDSIAIESYAGRFAGAAKAVVAGMHYAPFVEFGTSESLAQPFLRPAFDLVAPRLKRRMAYIFRLDAKQ